MRPIAIVRSTSSFSLNTACAAAKSASGTPVLATRVKRAHKLRGQRLQLRFDPLRRHVATERGDQHVGAAPAHVKETIRIERTEIAARPPRRCDGTAEIAQHQAARDLHFAVCADAQAGMRQRPTRAARAVRTRQIQGLDRRAFGQTIALVGG